MAVAGPPEAFAPLADPLRVILADNEPLARARLRELLADDPSVTVVAECGDGHETIAAIQSQDPDVVLLDIRMPEVDGFGVVRAVGADRMPAVVFVTASDAHAVRAFEVHAVDYVLKPVSHERLCEALRRAKSQVARLSGATADPAALIDLRSRLAALVADVAAVAGPAAGGGPAAADEPRLAIKAVRGNGRVVFVKAREVDWVEAMDNNLRLHVGRETHVIRDTLTNLERRLPASGFLRVHRSTVVNVDRIREIQPWFGGDYVVILTDGTKVTTGRRYRGAVQAFLARSL